MSAAQFKNSIKNLVEVYLPEAYGDKDTKVELAVGREWLLVFEDPSGVLDIWAQTPLRVPWTFDIMDDEFHYFLRGMASLGPGSSMKYKMGYFVLQWHSWGPP